MRSVRIIDSDSDERDVFEEDSIIVTGCWKLLGYESAAMRIAVTETEILISVDEINWLSIWDTRNGNQDFVEIAGQESGCRTIELEN